MKRDPAIVPRNVDTSQIKGWAADHDPRNDPVFPMRDWSREDKGGMDWPRSPQQVATVEILHSNERPTLAAVFGTPCPPSGLSGAIRRWAFRHSEGSWFHWLPLVFADRVNVVEGIVQDFAHGHIPRPFAEMGARAEWRYNKRGFVRKILWTLLVIVIIVAIIKA